MVVCGVAYVVGVPGWGDTLPVLLKETPKPNYGVEVPTEISGRVTLRSDDCNTVGVANVSVTDGYHVVKTGSDGRYTLAPSPDSVFIFISRPSGYDVKGDWYKPVSSSVDFELALAPGDESEFIFIHVTDTHVSRNPISVEGLSDFVREVNALRPKVLFVINSGDLINLSKSLEGTPEAAHAEMRNYVGIMNHLMMPHYNVAGDHADSSYRMDEFPRGDHRCGKPLYWEYLGPHFYSFEYGKLHFVSVDNGYHLGKRQINGREYPSLKVQPMHTAWMREDMANRTKGCFVVTMSEGDLCHDCPGFLDMAKKHDVRFQFTGDTHVVSEKPHFVPFRTGGALAGCWWNPKADRLCPDLNPQGYLIYRLRGETLDYFYKGLGQRVAIVSHRVAAPWKGRVTVQAHIVQPRDGETLEYRLDGGAWKPMAEIGRPFYRALFSCYVDSTRLADGIVQLDVRSSWNEEIRSRQFVIVNGTSDRVATPEDTRLTFTTAARLQKTPIAPHGPVDVVFNDAKLGELVGGALQEYSFAVPAVELKRVNTLRFRFHDPSDGMNISQPVLTVGDRTIRDPRDVAVRKVRVGHWGTEATEWGGFVVGDGDLITTPFLRRQNTFCFVLGE